MRATFISVPAPGDGLDLDHLARVLADAQVNIEAFSLDRAGAHFLSDEPGKAVENLRRHGYEPATVEVQKLDLPDRPGQLARLSETLRRAGLKIHMAFGIATPTSARLFVRASDMDLAEAVLLDAGLLDPS